MRLERASEQVTEAKAPLQPASAAAAGVSAHLALGTVEQIRSEIDDALADMKVFSKFEPDQVMAAVSAHSARLTEIVVQISRIEHLHRQWRPVREECERVLGELKTQLTIASRMHALREFDWNASGRGQA